MSGIVNIQRPLPAKIKKPFSKLLSIRYTFSMSTTYRYPPRRKRRESAQSDADKRLNDLVDKRAHLSTPQTSAKSTSTRQTPSVAASTYRPDVKPIEKRPTPPRHALKTEGTRATSPQPRATAKPLPRRSSLRHTRNTTSPFRRWILGAVATGTVIIAFGALILSQSIAVQPSPRKEVKPPVEVTAPQYDPHATNNVPIATALSVPKSNEVPPGMVGPIPDSASGKLVIIKGSAKGNNSPNKYTYNLAYEKGLNVNEQQLARSVHMVLNDPRGWGPSFNRVDGKADFRIAITTPSMTDSLCRPLTTRGVTNCAVGASVNLNARRWVDGAGMWIQKGRTVSDYRIYIINHETGHFLGHGHEFCPTAGNLAPTMQQQSSDGGPNRGCIPNGWPKLDNTKP